MKPDSSAMMRAGFAGLVDAAAGDARKLMALAVTAHGIGLPERAYPLAMEARALAPDDAEIAARTQRAMIRDVPNYHAAMLRDTPRNTAFDAAIRRAVRPGMRVIDIGAGSGLLSMMAARAGAAQVVACEIVPAVADAARAIVAHNGYDDRIRIVTGKSTELDVERDLGGPADLIVSEVLSNNLLSEGVLATLSDAARRMLAPGGRMIPAAGTVMVALAAWPGLDGYRIGDVAGFDLSGFNRLSRCPIAVPGDDKSLALRSAAAPLFSFDLAAPVMPRGDTTALTLAAKSGRIDGIVQWIRLDLDDIRGYENCPGDGDASHWAVNFHPLPEPRAVAAGTPIVVRGRHDGITVTLWAE